MAILLYARVNLIFRQFKTIVTRYKKICYMYNMDVLQQTACVVVNQIMVDKFISLFNCTTVVDGR